MVHIFSLSSVDSIEIKEEINEFEVMSVLNKYEII